MKTLFVLCCLVPSLVLAEEAMETQDFSSKSPTASANFNSPKIVPLDAASERALKKSSLAPYASQFDQEQAEFHRKANLAYQKISKTMSLPKSDSLYFVYDCLFLTNEGFFSKYSQKPKAELAAARQTVQEVFSK